MSLKVRARFEITGFVQGVGFRYYVYRNAISLKIGGFARNMYDGSVLVVAEGDEDSMAEFHDRLKSGPARARVDRCTAEYEEFQNEFTTFSIA